MCVGCGDDAVRIFDDVTSGEIALLHHIPQAHASDVNVVCWNPHIPHLLLSAGDDGCICLWHVITENDTSSI